MILFKEPSPGRILRGEKTQARKLWDRPRAKEGAEHLLYRRPPVTGEKPFAKVLITRVWKQRLGEMTEAEARAEGWPTKAAFLEQFTADRRFETPLDQIEVYALEFRLLEKYENVILSEAKNLP